MALVCQRLLNSIRSAVMIVLVLLYFISGVGADNLHQLLHSDHAALHDETEESDPCHRAVFHADENAGCGHQSHYSTNTKCQSCDLTCQSIPALLHHNAFSVEPCDVKVDFADSENPLIAAVNDSLPARGPPAC